MPAPFAPQDYLELIPGPGNPFCQAFLRDHLEQAARLDAAFAAYFLSEAGDLTDTEFSADLCALDCAGTGTGTPPGGTGPPGSGGDPNIPVPANVRASDGDYTDKVVVTWDAVTAASGFEIWRSGTNNAATAVKIGTVGASTLTFTDTNVEEGTTLFYWVRTLTATSVSLFGTSDSGYAVAEFTAQVTDLEASQGQGSGQGQQSFIYLTFTAVAGADGYDILRSETNDVATATIIDRNRQPFDNSEDFRFYPSGENPVKPYFVNGGNYLCYQDVLGSTDHYKQFFYWVIPKKMQGGQATAVGQVTAVAAVGWEAGDGATSSAGAVADALQVGRLSIVVPSGRTKAWIALNGCAGSGAGGSDIAGGGGGGGPGFTSGLLAVTGGDTLAIVYTPNNDPTRASQLTNGANGSEVSITLNGVPVMTISGGGGGVYDAGGAGAGGAGGVVTLNSVGGGAAFNGRDGLPAITVSLKGGRSGSSHFGFRTAPAHFGAQGQGLSWAGDSPNGGGGSKASPGASSFATGGVAIRNVARITFYS